MIQRHENKHSKPHRHSHHHHHQLEQLSDEPFETANAAGAEAISDVGDVAAASKAGDDMANGDVELASSGDEPRNDGMGGALISPLATMLFTTPRAVSNRWAHWLP